MRLALQMDVEALSALRNEFDALNLQCSLCENRLSKEKYMDATQVNALVTSGPWKVNWKIMG